VLGATHTYDPSDPAVGKLDFDVVVEAAGSASALSLAGKLVPSTEPWS